MDDMLSWFIISTCLPAFMGMLGYIIRLEVRIAKISRDICWIKDALKKSCTQEKIHADDPG